MGFKKRGQVAFEYITIISFGLLIVLGAVYVFYNYSVNSNDSFISSRITNFGNSLVKNIETIYYTTGVGSSVNIEFNLPDNIRDIYFVFDGSETELVVEYQLLRGLTESVFFTPVKLSSKFISSSKSRFFINNKVHSGTIRLRLTKTEDGILIEEI